MKESKLKNDFEKLWGNFPEPDYEPEYRAENFLNIPLGFSDERIITLDKAVFECGHSEKISKN